MIWFSLLIPILVIMFLFLRFKKRIHVIEYAALFFIPLVSIMISKCSSTYSQTHDTEFINTYITEAIYYEPWNEWINKTCEDVSYTTDSDGDRHRHVTYWPCPYVRNHSAEWFIKDNSNYTYSTSYEQFENLCKLWNNKKRVELNRHYHSIDGDAYYTYFDNVIEHIIPICKTHSYENKIQCSKTQFKFKEIDREMASKLGLFNYPEIQAGGKFNPILGLANDSASKKLQQYNAYYGASKQLHMMLLVYENEKVAIAFNQEDYWKGGNKNEFILCIGKDGDNIEWTKVISWGNDLLANTTTREIREMSKFDVMKIVEYMGTNIPKSFVRKQFKDFSYLKVKPTSGAILATYIIVLILSIGIAIFSVRNDLNFEDSLK